MLIIDTLSNKTESRLNAVLLHFVTRIKSQEKISLPAEKKSFFAFQEKKMRFVSIIPFIAVTAYSTVIGSTTGACGSFCGKKMSILLDEHCYCDKNAKKLAECIKEKDPEATHKKKHCDPIHMSTSDFSQCVGFDASKYHQAAEECLKITRVKPSSHH